MPSSVPLRVLRLCSVFEPPDTALTGRGAAFDPVGGMQSHTGQLTRALDALGLEQTVVTTRPPTAPRTAVVGERARVVRLGLPVRTFRQCYALPAAVLVPALARRADLLHAHLGEDLAVVPIAAAAARAARIPLVLTVHTSMRHTLAVTDLRSWVLKAAGGRIEAWGQQRAAARVIVLTPRLERLLAADGVPPEQIAVIPSGVTPSRWRLASTDDPAPAAGHPRVVFVGRLAAQKDPLLLIEAAARLRTPGARVVLVGDGPLRREVEAAVDQRGLRDRIDVLGFRPHSEVPAHLRHADVVVMPSRYEELGSALVEAMHAGRPIVATRTGGVPDAVGDAAVLVEPGDAGALADGIDRVLGDPSLAATLASAAAERSRAFDWDALSRRVLEVYRDVAGAGQRRRREERPPLPRRRRSSSPSSDRPEPIATHVMGDSAR